MHFSKKISTLSRVLKGIQIETLSQDRDSRIQKHDAIYFCPVQNTTDAFTQWDCAVLIFEDLGMKINVKFHKKTSVLKVSNIFLTAIFFSCRENVMIKVTNYVDKWVLPSGQSSISFNKKVQEIF